MKRPSAGTRIQIFGDSSTARDYTYVEDIFDGILKASNKCQGFEIFNLGETWTTSLQELISLIESSLCKKAHVEYLPPRSGEMQVTCADLRKSRQLLGYDPRVPTEEVVWRFV